MLISVHQYKLSLPLVVAFCLGSVVALGRRLSKILAITFPQIVTIY